MRRASKLHAAGKVLHVGRQLGMTEDRSVSDESGPPDLSLTLLKSSEAQSTLWVPNLVPGRPRLGMCVPSSCPSGWRVLLAPRAQGEQDSRYSFEAAGAVVQPMDLPGVQETVRIEDISYASLNTDCYRV
jgi:hypothetical protein